MGNAGLKASIARIAHRLEAWVDRIRPRRKGDPVILPFSGYETPDGIVLRGRVLVQGSRARAVANASRVSNLQYMISHFLTREVPDVTVQALGYSVKSDEEGYFRLIVPVPGGDPPATITAHLPDHDNSADIPVYLHRPGPQVGIISDIDDTVMRTEAWSLRRNLWTTLTGNAMTREIFDDALALMRDLTNDGQNPVFYVSSSPWNLHSFLNEVFVRAGLPIGPMFLRDYGVSDTQFITGTHGDHKGQAIDRIMAANPNLSFVLMGDTGQHDAEVYRDAIMRHAPRIARVILREPGPGPTGGVRAAMREIEELGVPLSSAPDYRSLITTT